MDIIFVESIIMEKTYFPQRAPVILESTVKGNYLTHVVCTDELVSIGIIDFNKSIDEILSAYFWRYTILIDFYLPFNTYL